MIPKKEPVTSTIHHLIHPKKSNHLNSQFHLLQSNNPQTCLLLKPIIPTPLCQRCYVRTCQCVLTTARAALWRVESMGVAHYLKPPVVVISNTAVRTVCLFVCLYITLLDCARAFVFLSRVLFAFRFFLISK